MKNGLNPSKSVIKKFSEIGVGETREKDHGIPVLTIQEGYRVSRVPGVDTQKPDTRGRTTLPHERQQKRVSRDEERGLRK